MDLSNLCISCFRRLNPGQSNCPYCGYPQSDIPKEKFHLAPKTVIHNRYVIGHACGTGGFGITYKALDLQLNEVVAIKEFFPSGMVQRVPGEKNIIVFGNKRDAFEKEKERFLLEARTIAKFAGNENIVDVYNYFEENQTAYIVMEFLDGISLKDYLKQCGGKLDLKTAVEITQEILKGLKVIHQNKIIHRDVSADNVMLTLNNKIKLFDFGAARISSEDDKTRTVVVKKGYAPPEQYRNKSKQGPYTDVYAVGALFYFMLTGELPPESVDRAANNEKVVPPSKLVPKLPAYIDHAIMKALAVKPELRFRNADEFLRALVQKKEVLTPERELKKRKAIRRSIFSFIIVVLVGVLSFSGVVGYGVSNFQIGVPAPLTVLMVRPDGVSPDQDEAVAQELISNYQVYMQNQKYKKFAEFNDQIIQIDFASPEEYQSKLLDENNQPRYDVYLSDYLTGENVPVGADLSWAIEQVAEFYPYPLLANSSANRFSAQFDCDVLYINRSLFGGTEEEAVIEVRTALADIVNNNYNQCLIDPACSTALIAQADSLTREQINQVNSRITGNTNPLTSAECSALFAQGKIKAYIGKYSQRNFDRKNIHDLVIVPLCYKDQQSADSLAADGISVAFEGKQNWCLRSDLSGGQFYEGLYFICCMADGNTQQMLSANGYAEYLSGNINVLKQSQTEEFILKALGISK